MKRRRRADAEGADNESANGGGASEVEAVPVHAGNAGSQMRKDVHATGAGDYGDNDDETTPVDLDTAHADVTDKNADNVKDMDREEGHTSASSPQSSARKPSPLPPLKKQDEPLPASQPVKADAPQPAKSDTPLPTKQSTTAQPSRHQNQAQRTFDHASLIPAFLEESLFAPRVDAPPLVDGLVKCVADFLFQHLHLPNIEVVL